MNMDTYHRIIGSDFTFAVAIALILFGLGFGIWHIQQQLDTIVGLLTDIRQQLAGAR